MDKRVCKHGVNTAERECPQCNASYLADTKKVTVRTANQ
jgi:ribosomal protein S27AE